MPKTDFEEMLMVYTRLYKIAQVYRVNHRRRRQQQVDREEEALQEKQRKVYL